MVRTTTLLSVCWWLSRSLGRSGRARPRPNAKETNGLLTLPVAACHHRESRVDLLADGYSTVVRQYEDGACCMSA